MPSNRWVVKMLTGETARLVRKSLRNQLGRLAEARALAAESLKLQPSFTLRVWTTIEPYESRANLDDLLKGLRKAGLPE